MEKILIGVVSAVILSSTILPASASVVYTPTDITVKAHILRDEAKFGLDLNGDGITDVTFAVSYLRAMPCVGGGIGTNTSATETPATGNGAQGYPPSALTKGDPIGPSQNYQATWGLLKAFYGCSDKQIGSFGSQDRYLGVAFQIDGETHYGWVCLSVIADSTEASITVTGYAYETEPGKEILAGLTHEEE